jgi:hypothetical protein
MNQYNAQIISAVIAAVGGVVTAYLGAKLPKNNQKEGEHKDMSQKYIKAITVMVGIITTITLYIGSQYAIAQINKSAKATKAYIVYSDAGIPQGDIWVWSGADWGKAPPIKQDGSYKTADSPEGTKCFAIVGGAGEGNYVGWGVFLGQFKNHKCLKPYTVDLSRFSSLKFNVKTDIDLKVEIQQDRPDGRKSSSLLISEYGWSIDSKDHFVEISIPLSAFGDIDTAKIFSPFMITGLGGGAKFYVDNVRWVP